MLVSGPVLPFNRDFLEYSPTQTTNTHHNTSTHHHWWFGRKINWTWTARSLGLGITLVNYQIEVHFLRSMIIYHIIYIYQHLPVGVNWHPVKEPTEAPKVEGLVQVCILPILHLCVPGSKLVLVSGGRGWSSTWLRKGLHTYYKDSLLSKRWDEFI